MTEPRAGEARRSGEARQRHYFNRVDGGSALHPCSLPELRVADRGLNLHSGKGVFSRQKPDRGSRLLLATAALPAAGCICDLGCGWGLLGCGAAATVPDAHIYLVDINLAACRLAHLNLRENALPHGTVWCGDGLQACPDACFDAILCNPPIRAGNAVLGRLFADARRCLRPGGSLWCVLRTAQGALSWQDRLESLFGHCTQRAVKGGFRVLQCVRASG